MDGAVGLAAGAPQEAITAKFDQPGQFLSREHQMRDRDFDLLQLLSG